MPCDHLHSSSGILSDAVPDSLLEAAQQNPGGQKREEEEEEEDLSLVYAARGQQQTLVCFFIRDVTALSSDHGL